MGIDSKEERVNCVRHKLESEDSPETRKTIDILAKRLFGRSINDPCCIICGSEKIKPEDFRDRFSIKEFQILRICQACQDDIFK